MSFQNELCKAIVYKRAIASRESHVEDTEDICMRALEQEEEDARQDFMGDMLSISFTTELQMKIGSLDSLNLKTKRLHGCIDISLSPAIPELFFEGRVCVSALFNLLDHNRFSGPKKSPSWVLGENASWELRKSECWILHEQAKPSSDQSHSSDPKAVNVAEVVDNTIGLMRKLVTSELSIIR